MNNRRGLIVSLLLALPTAAAAALRKKPLTTTVQVAKFPVGMPFEKTHLCFNCQRFTAPSKWSAAGADGLFAVPNHWGQFQYHHLCDDCVKAITNCATCGVKLNGFPTDKVEEWGKVSGLRLSPVSEPMAFRAWPALPRTLPPEADYYEIRFGTRPVNRDLIVADCPKCALMGRISVNQARSLHGLPPLPDSIVVVDDPLTSSEIRNICYTFNIPPSQLL